MRKELNPALFGESSIPTSSLAETVFKRQTGENDYLLLEQKIAELRIQSNNLSDHLAKAVGQINEYIKGSHHKFEKIQQALSRSEQALKDQNVDTSQRLNVMQTKLSDRKSMDLKIQEMIDRHNSVMKTYEVRLNQMQKLLTEKEAQVFAAQSALNETKMEIARLKRL